MRALVDHIVAVRDDGGRDRYFTDDRHRWVIHRLWIAVGNEAVTYTASIGGDTHRAEPWNTLRRLRNDLAHRRLPDIDEGFVWRTSQMRADTLRTQLDELIGRDIPTADGPD